MKIRSALPCLTRLLNDSCRSICFPSRGTGTTASLVLSWASARTGGRLAATAAANRRRRQISMASYSGSKRRNVRADGENATLSNEGDVKRRRLPRRPGFEQPAFIGEENLARVEILEAAQPVGAPINPDHPAVGHQQLPELVSSDNLSF